MGVTPTKSSKVHHDELLDYKRKERLLIIGVIIIFAVYFIVSIIYNLQSILSTFLIPPNSILFPIIERITIKGTSVTKSTYMNFVTINFANTGNINTSISSVLLNGVPYNDPGWMGTVKPVVLGDISPNAIIDTGAPYTGIIYFSDDCKDPSGNKLIAGVMITITIHTTGGKDYNASVTLP